MSTNKHHNERVEKYLKGELNPEEQHQLEFEALHDPFLADALDGLSQATGNVFDDINNLKGKVQNQEKKDFQWMTVAAVIALLIISTLTVYFTANNFQDKKELAMEEELAKPEVAVQDSIAESPKKMTRTNEKDLVAERSRKTLNEDGARIDQEASEIIDIVTQEEFEFTKKDSKEPKLAEAIDVDVEKIDIPADAPAIAPEETSFNATSTATIPMTDPTTSMKTDSQPRLLIAEQPSTSDPSQEEDRAKKKKSTVLASRLVATDELLEGSSSALQEVVVTGYGQSNSSANSDAAPEGGNDALRDYINQNIVYPDSARAKGIEGEVILQLIIGTDGQILDIESKDSLGHGCDEEAIRLIEAGPNWIPAAKAGRPIQDTVNVKVKFKL